MLEASQVSTEKELQQILHLQRQNLHGINDYAIEKEQGFVTVTHSLEQLKQMHNIAASVIVKEDDVLAGYALVMPIACSTVVPELFPMFERFGKMKYTGKPVEQYNFYVMGQICVAAAYRGKGVFDMLYNKHREAFQNKYDFIITEIATRNARSIRAHERIGFKTVDIYKDDLDEWAVVIWDWS
ncbi:MAG: GNAT family N-acetyltransferase [Bacteroidota bacterium]